MTEQPNENFCPWPFMHMSTHNNSQLRACCVAEPFNIKIGQIEDLEEWWKTYPLYQELRQSFKDNKKHPLCNGCWQQEDVGFLSMRNRLNLSSANVVDMNNFNISDVEITGGRLCNLNCRMCSGYSSNQIEKESRPWESEYFGLGNKVNWLDDPIEQDKFLKLLVLPSVRNIYFTGGEPQLMPCYQEILGKLSKLRNLNQLSVHFNTNSTVFNEEFWKLIKQFRKRQVDISIDGVGATYEIIRYGNTTWNKTVENLYKIRDYLADDPNQTEIYLNVVAQLANLDSAVELQQLFDDLNNKDNLRLLATVLPVMHNKEWEWQNVPAEILTAELEKLSNHIGAVIDLFKDMIQQAINNNTFSKDLVATVFVKENYFKEKFGVCIWDRRPDWLLIYQALA